MFVSTLRLVNFRSYCDASVRFGVGLNVVVGENATGKTNLLEGAWFALRGSSPRTRREDKLITWGERVRARRAGARRLGRRPSDRRGRLRPRAGQAHALGRRRGDLPRRLARRVARCSSSCRRVCCSSRAARRDGAPISTPSPARWTRPTPRPPARRRRRCASATRSSSRSRTAPPARLSILGTHSSRARPWSSAAAAATWWPSWRPCSRPPPPIWRPAARRFALHAGRAARGRGLRRGALCTRSCAGAARERRRAAFRCSARTATTCASSRCPPRRLATQRVASRGAAGRSRRDDPSPGPVCGPVDLPRGGRDLRLFGSQGEQRAAVLALLLAEQQLAAARTGEQGTLFLDDVMSELDDARRRLLVRRLASAGQAIITTTNRHYFTEDELAEATVIELPLDGSLARGAGAAAVRRGRRRRRRWTPCERRGTASAPPARGSQGRYIGRRAPGRADATRRHPRPGARPARDQRAGARVRARGRAPPAIRSRAAPARASSRAGCSPSSARRRCGPTSSPTSAASSCGAWTRSSPGHPVKRFRFVVERAAAGAGRTRRGGEEGAPAQQARAGGSRGGAGAGGGGARRASAGGYRGRTASLGGGYARRLRSTAPRKVDKNRCFAAISLPSGVALKHSF